MATARNYIEDALQEIGVLAAGETADAADAAWGLKKLNRLLNTYNAEQLIPYTRTRSTWTITANDGSYTVGSGGDVDISRPVWVDAVYYQDTSSDPDYEYPLHKLTEWEYQNIRQKALTSTQPTSYYYNPTFSSGLDTVDFWPVPTSSTLEGVIYHWAVLATIAGLTTTVSYPPAYEEMLIANLALSLCPSFEKAPHPELVERAKAAKADVKRRNIRPSEMLMQTSASFSGRRTYNIYTDR